MPPTDLVRDSAQIWNRIKNSPAARNRPFTWSYSDRTHLLTYRNPPFSTTRIYDASGSATGITQRIEEIPAETDLYEIWLDDILQTPPATGRIQAEQIVNDLLHQHYLRRSQRTQENAS